jgi:hypothetical protein
VELATQAVKPMEYCIVGVINQQCARNVNKLMFNNELTLLKVVLYYWILQHIVDLV